MSQKAPIFASQNQSAFYATLKQRINLYFNENKLRKTGNYKLYLKTVLLFALYLIPFILIFSLGLSVFWTIVSYLIMGLGMAGIGFCVMHDANHGSFSTKSWINSLLSYSMDMLGGNAVTWKVQHNILHHTYTNVYGHDEDVHDKPILRLAPEGKWKKIYQFQHYYAVILYGLSTLQWITVKDFKQVYRYDKMGLLSKIGEKASRVYANIAISKVLYLGTFFVLPYFIGVQSWYIYIIGFVCMHFVAGLITTVIFQLAHVVEHTDYFQPNESNQLENSWAIHQLLTTCNFAKGNKFLSWYVGGLNYQIEHHLFPQISHVHYSNIAPIVKQTAQEYHIPYYEMDTLGTAIKSHWSMLKDLGQPNAA